MRGKDDYPWQARRVSSRDLVEQYAARIQQKNRKVNAIVATRLDAARRQADAADAVLARGEPVGPLHGLPITLKDTWEMPGLPCAAGAPEYRRHHPAAPAVAVQRLLDAGAIVLGKTNVPYLASDIQTFNRVYGVSNNPWRVDRTPGGSSGGAAAALAAGLTTLELGSDLAGSIRIPAHFCGVYGHKPTHGLIPLRGHIPGPPGTLNDAPMVVAGPMSRSAADLRLMMDVLTRPSPERAAGRVRLPPSAKRRLKDFRVLLWIADPVCPIDSEMTAQYWRLKSALQAAGVSVTEAGPRGASLRDILPLYMGLLGAFLGADMPRFQRQLMGMAGALLPLLDSALRTPPVFGRFLSGANMSYADVRQLEEREARLKQEFCAVFDDYDVILMPPAAIMAIPHQHKPVLAQRRILIDGEERSYVDLFPWISVATLFDLPATCAPVGVAANGLPVNIQIMGAPYQDLTTIRFAELLEAVTGGFQAPPDF